ncbi:HipA domain-containing protein [Shewanella sp. A32]|uniref:type II toxin-antitoxin system HipA family toxin n=1 Tax=Shewanella sp. A32 TaxID=3031327 RepID=UPI0023B92BFD|nr:HipA domain-containing protein [Shewanella sp. A32]MDF0535749.1 HipA domain-containing protein [Shewanella sp. A32]
MMTSDNHYTSSYVWIWLPGATTPVVAGQINLDGSEIHFNYGRGYLERTKGAIPIYEPELPLQSGIIPLLEGLTIPGCIRDGAPDAWGRRVIINKQLGAKGQDIDPGQLNEMTYLLESGSDRIGALDFQLSAHDYIPRSSRNASMEELMQSAERVEKGEPLTPELDQALFHGSSIGGARPKALIEGDNRKFIAKFSSSSDMYSVVKAEYIAMRLAQMVGLKVAPVRLEKAAGKDVLLVERFDRELTPNGWTRKSIVSALTLFGFNDMEARYASYETLAEIIRSRFVAPKATLREMFGRLVFSILSGNTDDHARNHAAFWDGKSLSLTPAYDICPQGRSGGEATQAMLISGQNRFSQLATCLHTANNFLLSEDEAKDIFEHQITTIENNWDHVCEEAELTEIDKRLLWRRQFLNPYSVQSK